MPLKIAHLVDTLTWGGAQKLLATFVEAASRRGIRPTIINLHEKRQPNLVTHMEQLGATIIQLSVKNLSDLPGLGSLVNTLRREKVEILHTHLSHANILGPIAGQITGIPVVSTLHNTQLRKDGSYQLRLAAENFTLQHLSRRVIAVGHTVAQANQDRMGKKQMDIIQNAVAPGLTLPEPERLSLRQEVMGDPTRLLLLTIGRLTPQKGYADLLTAIAPICRAHPEVFLAIVGAGGLQAALTNQIAELRLENNVRLLGLRNDVPRLLAASDMYVSSSHWEGLSVAMLEAMAAGLPIAATSVGDAPFVLENGRGELFQPQNIAAMTESISRLVENPDLRQSLGEAARHEAETRYAPDPWLDALLQIYKQARGVSS